MAHLNRWIILIYERLSISKDLQRRQAVHLKHDCRGVPAAGPMPWWRIDLAWIGLWMFKGKSTGNQQISWEKHGKYGKIPWFPVDFPETNLLIGDLETTREWRLPISHLLYRIRFWVFTALRMILPNGFWIGTYAYRNLPDAFFQSITTWNNPTALKTQYTVYSVHSILLPSLNYIELFYGLGNAIQKKHTMQIYPTIMTHFGRATTSAPNLKREHSEPLTRELGFWHMHQLPERPEMLSTSLRHCSFQICFFWALGFSKLPWPVSNMASFSSPTKWSDVISLTGTIIQHPTAEPLHPGSPK